MNESAGAIASSAEHTAACRLARFARAPGVDTRSGDGWLAVATGVRSNDTNGVVSVPGALVSLGLVDELISWFRERHLPASWIAERNDPTLTELLVARGATVEATGWWGGRAIGDDLFDTPAQNEPEFLPHS